METDRQLKESGSQLDEKFMETDRILKENWTMIKELGVQIGGVHKSFENFTEDLFFSSLQLQLEKQFNIEVFDTNVSRSYKGDGFEADALAYSNGVDNKLFVIEIKTRFSKEALKQLTDTIERVKRLCPEHKDKKKFGIIAVPHLKENQLQEILSMGFYPATLKGDIVVIEFPKNFKARVF